MKLKDCKIGMTILATKKTPGFTVTMDDFLKENPLGISKIKNIYCSVIEVKYHGNYNCSFNASDLIEVK